ncbi:glycoside hydrolase family 97 protein [Carboxylicivirga mesophila]|uniref:Glycoside hydrolase family 97 protein n=1 Tax=Carboxylicivirga mesophila TaxID=1166478 RepID=A0ABS5K6Y1_9BACT|nr:glycoside hydrolase family 97 protein [Carboxylicivirga mesophila]MBS2210682.1 glycoside hydrolase family 97 protein [Carboxylicivirga mesophila]
MKQLLKNMLALLFGGCLIQPVAAEELKLTSFDGNTVLTVNVDEQISWSVEKYNRTILPKVIVDMTVNGNPLAKSPSLKSKSEVDKGESFEVIVPLKNREVPNEYKELQLDFKGGFGLQFRVYNEGVAYRFVTSLRGDVEVNNEVMDMVLPDGTNSYFPKEVSTYSHYERNYLQLNVDSIPVGDFCSLPVLFNQDNDQLRVLFSEANVYDYPNMFLESAGNKQLVSRFPKAVKETIPQPGAGADRNVLITKEHDYIAKTNGKRTYPWRLFVITNDDKSLLEQDMVLKLSDPLKIEDTSWIKPGKVAWDWWNDNNIYGVDFESGLNTKTYKYFIDFASSYGIEYVILDEGWTKSTTEILDFNPDMDVKGLIRYGEEKGVGVILWCLWKPLDENMQEILDTYAGWGAKGIKVDFMQRADQYMVNSYEQIAKECAERKLLVDYHGSYKPNGLRRAYPNVISYEGVKGNENNKWSEDITPLHNTILPFIRMAVGPMDYTPGAMINMQKENFNISFSRPMSMGTRCHQMAMYVVFESGLQMMCDNPSNYYKEEECTQFISKIPSVWDRTIAMQASVGEYVAIARQNGKSWYLGGMSNWEERTIHLDFSFLPTGTFELELFTDGANANRFAQDYKVKTITVHKGDKLTLKLAKGGGFVGILNPLE